MTFSSPLGEEGHRDGKWTWEDWKVRVMGYMMSDS